MASSTSTVAVTGASGFVGRYVVRELLARGHTVRALVRDSAKAREVLPKAPQLVVGDVDDLDRVDALLKGADACVNLIGIIRETRPRGERARTFQRLHVDATRRLVARCEALGVRRFLQMSALGVKPDGVSEYQRTKFEAESIVKLSTLAWTIMRPSLIHGPDGEFIKMAKGWVTGAGAPYIFLPYFTRGVQDYRVPLGPVDPVDPKIQPIAVEDVASAFAAALESPNAVGEIYNLAGGEVLTWPVMLRFIRDRTPGANERLQPWGLPGAVAAIAAKAASFIGLDRLLPFDAGQARMGAEDSIATTDKAREDLALDPRPFRAAFAAYAPQI